MGVRKTGTGKEDKVVQFKMVSLRSEKPICAPPISNVPQLCLLIDYGPLSSFLQLALGGLLPAKLPTTTFFSISIRHFWHRSFVVCVYITSRIHTVILNGQSSRPVDVFFGVPQGSVPGPIFFILFSVPHYSLTEAETSELSGKTGFQSEQTPLYAPSSSSFSLVTSPNQNRLQNSQLSVTTHLISLAISLCTLFPNNFVFRQTRGYYVAPMLRQKPLANAVSLTVIQTSGILLLLTFVRYSPSIQSKLH